MISWLEPPADIILVALVTAVVAGVLAWRRESLPWVWIVASMAAYIAGSQLIRAVIPDSNQQFEPGQQPGASYVLWSDPAFRSDLALVLLLIAGLAVLSSIIGRLMAAADATRLDKKGLPVPAAPLWVRRLSAAGSALWLSLPLIIWLWAGLYFIVQASFTSIVVPLLLFVALAALGAAITLWLEAGLQANAALLALAIVAVAAQLRFNATRPPASMFESNGSFPFFIPLIPVMLGVMLGGILKTTLRRGQVVLAAWRVGNVLWLTTGVAWLVRFAGVYDFENSHAYNVASLLEMPLRVVDLLADAYYSLVPRTVVAEQNVANMERWTTVVAFVAGVVVWLAVTRWALRHAERLTRLPGAEWRANFVLRLTLQQRRYLLAFVLVLPALALRTFTSFYPFLQTIILSVQKYNPAFPPRRYIAVTNFQKLSTDLVVRESLEFTLVFVFVSTFFQIVLGLAIAHLLNANFRLRGLARTISLIPWAVPMVVAAIGFRWMFDDQFGMIPDILRRLFGYDGKWLVDPRNAQIAVIFVNIWKSTPFCALLLLAGLQGISLDLYEAAKVDGANWLDSLRFITVPMLLPIIVTTTMFMLVWQLAVFDLPFAMTGGAPGFSTTLVAQKIYLEINSLNYSFAAAVSIMLVLVVTAIGAAGLYSLRRVEVPA